MSDPNATRAPWAKPVGAVLPASLQGHPLPQPQSSFPSNPAASGSNLTRAPWANGTSGPDPMAGTRAPWRQGVSVPGSQPVEKIDFDVIQKYHPEYAASIANIETTTKETDHTAATPSTSAPVPTTATIYSAPCKVIKTPPYLPLWKQTAAYAELTGFILLLNERVKGVKVKMEGGPSKKYSITPKVQILIDWILEVKSIIASIPPVHQAMRYGNTAFRTWYGACLGSEKLAPMLQKLLGEQLTQQGADKELAPYLQDAFGSLQRIDYGTGHELNFVLCLCALNKLGVFDEKDHIALVLEVFRHYVLLMQELQHTYWLEPAGSKGAWGLDDYCFLPFLWGSSQLLGSSIQPADILKENIVESGADQFLYLLAIKFIHKVKKGPFYEHSAYLHQISQLPTWQKANSGLIKMYDEEVLNKFPIVQHILFGRILQFMPHHAGDKLGITDALNHLHSQPAKPPVPKFDAEPVAASSSSSAEVEAAKQE